MISSNPSSRLPSNAGANQQLPEQNPPVSSPSADLKPSYSDDDEFYIIVRSSSIVSSKLREDVVKKLSKDHPGIFEGLVDPINLIDADPVRYQPLAKLIMDSRSDSVFKPDRFFDNDSYNRSCWDAEKITYGLYKHGFYRIMEDHFGEQWVESYPDRYEAMKKSQLHVSQLREFLFDRSISDLDKVAKLQMLFPPIGEGEEEITIDQLLENTEFLFGDTFKEAKQRAIEYGLQP